MALEGNLTDLPLVDLLEILHDDARTGVLSIDATSANGTLCFERGTLIDATLSQRLGVGASLQADDAVLRMLEWQEAEFVFAYDPTVAARARRVAHAVPWLIETHRERSAEPIALAPETTLRFAPAPPVGGVRVTLAEWRVLSQVSVSNDVADLIQRVGIARDDAVRAISRLVRRGLIEPQARTLLAPVAVAVKPAAAGARSSAPAIGSALLSAILRRVRSL